MHTRATNRSDSPLREPLSNHSLSALARLANTATMAGEAASSNYHHESSHAADDATFMASTPIFTPISAPVLRSIDPVRVVAFLKERERYELEIQLKTPEVPSLREAPYTVSVDRVLLKNLIWMGKFKTIAPGATMESITSDQVKEYLLSLVSGGNRIDADTVERSLQGIRWPSNIDDVDARVTSYCSDFLERLDRVGCRDLVESNAKQAVHLLLRRVQPTALKNELQRQTRYDKQMEKDVQYFITRLTEEAQACEKYSAKEGKTNQNSGGGAPRSDNKPDKKQPKSEKGKSDKHEPEKSSTKEEDPLCLWPTHKDKGIRHRLKDCPDCPSGERQALFDAMRKERSKKDARRLRGADVPKHGESSAIFTATLGGSLLHTICADNGADANILGAATLEKIEESGGNVTIEQLRQPRIFHMAAHDPSGAESQLRCARAATMDTDVHIRHGAALKIRRLRWLVTEQDVPEPLLGRPLLEALGLDTQEILAAAADKYAGTVDAQQLTKVIAENGPGNVARVLEGVYHTDEAEAIAEDDPSTTDWCDLGPETTTEWEKELAARLQDASSAGISAQGRTRLENLLRKHRDVIRVRLDGRPHAKVSPLKIRVKPDACPVRAKPRKYPPEKREFLQRYCDQLGKLGFVKPAQRTEWVAAPLIVPKNPPAMFRLTMDYRPVNAATLKTTWPMPHIDAVLTELQGARAFANIDFCSGYWQLPLHEDSQHLFSFMTTNGVVQPTRTTQGGCNSAPNFQACVEPCFQQLRKHILAWLDDFIVHEVEEEKLLNVLEVFFAICVERNLVISIAKSRFFTRTVKWCGRVIDKAGITLDPACISGLTDMKTPRTAAELCQYVHAMTWMANSIPRFAERVSPLRDLLEVAYKLAGKRTKRSIAKVQLAKIGWNGDHEQAFSGIQEQLRHMVSTAHRDASKTLCVYTDASDSFWAAAITQCPEKDLKEAVDSQNHEPLAFLSAPFSEAQEHWTTFEKEAFAVVQSFRKMSHLFACDDTTTVFTDHRNLLFTFHPSALDSSLGRHKIMKVIRWAIFLSTFSYTIQHIAGDENVMADILTRWMRGYRGHYPTVRRLRDAQHQLRVNTAPEPDSTTWPTRLQLLSAQQQSAEEPKSNLTTDTDGLLRIRGAVWIPSDAHEMQLKLLTVAHAGTAGHRGTEATMATISSSFRWKYMRRDVEDFTAECILCLLSKTGERIPRPLATTLHGDKPNQVLHFDYLFLGTSAAGDMYTLVLKDDLSGYAWLESSERATADHASKILSRWIRTFSPPEFWVSDQGSHFVNSVIAELADRYRIKHRPTVAYCPWANGTVERLNRDVLAAMKALLGELKLAPQDWAFVIGMVQSALNEAPSPRLGRSKNGDLRTPIEAMTGIRPLRILDKIVADFSPPGTTLDLTRARAEQLVKLGLLQDSMDAMHKDTARRVSERRQRAIDAHNKATNLQQPNFTVGDFVLVRRREKTAHKLQFKWCGPRRIVATASPLVYVVEKLGSKSTERVHAARLFKYAAQLDGETVPNSILELADRTEAKYEVLDAIVDISENDEGFWFRLRWEGLPDERDYTWALAKDVYDDVPDMVLEFLRRTSKKKLSTKVSAHIGVSL